uniref:Uncharacterized protein n=1 Tax=Lepeophtheirus salmonis TaxID=72036 RepID=A0A0K2UD37_LEPSM
MIPEIVCDGDFHAQPMGWSLLQTISKGPECSMKWWRRLMVHLFDQRFTCTIHGVGCIFNENVLEQGYLIYRAALPFEIF